VPATGSSLPDARTDEPFAAVIFDLDGVIVDSEIWWDDARREWAESLGLSWTTEDRAAVMGANSAQWSRTMRERLEVTETPAAIESTIVERVIRRYEEEGPPLIPGAVEAVRRIARTYAVAVASSAHRAVIDAALRTTGLAEVFRVVVSSDEVAQGKPAPDVYLLTAGRLGLAPEACLVVEDSRNGVLAARAAGMTVILVPNRSIPPAAGAEEAADLVLPSLGDFDPQAVRREA
jgi:HAD superfamily hydrolase (TIGR01509 family)